jgi:hypothetical protein
VSDDATEQADEPAQPTLAYPQSRPMPYGSSPYAITVTPGAVPDNEGPRRPVLEMADVWTAVLGTIGVALLGVVAGFVWAWLAPRAMAVADGKGKSGLINPETKAFAGADVMFLFIGVGAGLLCGSVAAILARRRGVAVSVAMALGGTLASLLAAFIGRALSGGPARYWADHVSAGNHRYFIELITRQYLVGWPLAALAVTFVVGLLTPDPPVDIEPAEQAPADSAPWPV